MDTVVVGGIAILKEPVVFSGRFGQQSLGEVDGNRALVAGLALMGLPGGPVCTHQ